MHDGKMHIACPHCRTVYNVPESKLGSVLFLRCGVCAHRWPLASDNTKATLDESPSNDEVVLRGERLDQPTTGLSDKTLQPEPVISATVESVSVESILTAFPQVGPDLRPISPSFETTQRASEPGEDNDPEYDPTPEYTEQSEDIYTPSPKPSISNWNWIGVSLWTLLLCLILLTLVVLARHEVIKLIPASARLFSKLGLLS